MSPQAIELIKAIAPLLGVFTVAGIGYFIKLLIERKRNIERAHDHAWVEIWPEVGKIYQYLTPILEGGTVRIQDRHDKEFARYVLSSGSAKKADWPPGRPNFVQVTLDKLIFREGDAIPISAQVADRPVFDAHQLDGLIENVAVAAAEATRISIEESKGTVRKSHPLLWVYIIILIILATVLWIAGMQFGLHKDIVEFIIKAKASLGLQ